MSYLFGSNVECLYSLAAPVTKNTYTTAAPITAPTVTPTTDVARVPASFWTGGGSRPPGKGLWVHAQGTITNAATAATFIGQACLNQVAGTLLAAGSFTFWPILAPTASTVCLFDLDVWYTCSQGGASATIQANSRYEQSVVATGVLSTAPQTVKAQASLTTLNTQADMYVELFGTWSSSSGSNSTVVQQFQVFGLN
jgi:hypothetical protein